MEAYVHDKPNHAFIIFISEEHLRLNNDRVNELQKGMIFMRCNGRGMRSYIPQVASIVR